MLSQETLETIEAIFSIMAFITRDEQQKEAFQKTAEAARAWENTLHATTKEEKESAELKAFEKTCQAIDAWTNRQRG